MKKVINNNHITRYKQHTHHQHRPPSIKPHPISILPYIFNIIRVCPPIYGFSRASFRIRVIRVICVIYVYCLLSLCLYLPPPKKLNQNSD